MQRALSKEVLRNIRQIQIKMDHLATDILAGMYRSAFKGRGMEFEEVREYQTGDEIRSIDWNVTARMNHPYIKIFREERELTVILMVDVSASLHFGTIKSLKSTLVAEIAAVLAFSGIKNQDKIGLILFSEQVEKYLPPKKGTRHVLRLIRDLMVHQAKNKGTNIASALAYLAKVQKKACVVFLFSDFVSPNFAPQATIIAKKHDLIAIHVSDPRESIIPPIGLLQVEDLETGEMTLVDTDNQEFQAQLAKSFSQRVSNVKKTIESAGGSWIDVTTAKPYLLALRKFFKQREAKIR